MELIRTAEDMLNYLLALKSSGENLDKFIPSTTMFGNIMLIPSDGNIAGSTVIKLDSAPKVSA